MNDEIRVKRVRINVTKEIYSELSRLSKQAGMSQQELCNHIIKDFFIERETRNIQYKNIIQILNDKNKGST